MSPKFKKGEDLARKAIYRRLTVGKSPTSEEYTGKDLNKFILAVSSTRKDKNNL